MTYSTSTDDTMLGARTIGCLQSYRSSIAYLELYNAQKLKAYFVSQNNKNAKQPAYNPIALIYKDPLFCA